MTERTRNQLGWMLLGALAVGVGLVAGLYAEPLRAVLMLLGGGAFLIGAVNLGLDLIQNR